MKTKILKLLVVITVVIALTVLLLPLGSLSAAPPDPKLSININKKADFSGTFTFKLFIVTGGIGEVASLDLDVVGPSPGVKNGKLEWTYSGELTELEFYIEETEKAGADWTGWGVSAGDYTEGAKTDTFTWDVPNAWTDTIKFKNMGPDGDDSEADLKVETETCEEVTIKVKVKDCEEDYVIRVQSKGGYDWEEKGDIDSSSWSKEWTLDLAPGEYQVSFRTRCMEKALKENFTIDPCPEDLGIIGVEKVDSVGNILTGAGFTLYNADKSAVIRAEEMVDAAGKVAFKNLPLGKYVVSETTVPGGYSGMADKTIVVNAGNVGSVINVIATNTSTVGGGEEVEVQALTEEGSVEVLAFTGQNPLFYIIGFLLFAIAGGLAFGLKAVRKRQ